MFAKLFAQFCGIFSCVWFLLLAFDKKIKKINITITKATILIRVLAELVVVVGVMKMETPKIVVMSFFVILHQSANQTTIFTEQNLFKQLLKQLSAIR